MKPCLFSDEFSFLVVNLDFAAPKVCIFRLDHLGTLEDLPKSIKEGKYHQTKIARDEVCCVEGTRPEDVEAVEKCDDKAHAHSEPRDPRLNAEWGPEGKAVCGPLLRDIGSSKADIGVENDHVNQQERHSREIDEPVQHRCSRIARIEESEAGNGCHHCQSHDRHAGFVALLEDGGGFIVQCESV